MWLKEPSYILCQWQSRAVILETTLNELFDQRMDYGTYFYWKCRFRTTQRKTFGTVVYKYDLHNDDSVVAG